MAGVSVTKPRGPSPIELLLPVALDAEATSKRLTELMEATAKHMKAVELHGKADQIDTLVREAQQNADRKKADLLKAKEQAKQIISEAEEKAEAIVSEAGSKAVEERKKIKSANDRLRAREEKVKEKESQIDPLHAEALSLKEEAESAKGKADRTREAFERKIRILEEAIREAAR